MNISANYSDFTQVTVNSKQFLMIGTPREWAAYVRAGYTVSSALRPVKGNPPSYFLTMLVPELGRYVSQLRDEDLDNPLTDEDLLTYVKYHAEYFQARRQVA